MIKHFCDLCGKEIPLKSTIINYIPVGDESPDQYDVCNECDAEITYLIHKLKTKKGDK